MTEYLLADREHVVRVVLRAMLANSFAIHNLVNVCKPNKLISVLGLPQNHRPVATVQGGHLIPNLHRGRAKTNEASF